MQNNLILWNMMLIFLTLGVTMPFVEKEFNDIDITYNTDAVNVDDNVKVDDVLLSIGTVVFWSFNIPIWLNLILLMPLRILFYVIIYDKLRGI